MNDSNVTLDLYTFEEIIMPQFHINYAPNMKIVFHMGWSPVEDILINRLSVLSINAENIISGDICGFSLQKQNYDFINENPEPVSKKLIDLYHHRQVIIDDFRAERPECFE